MDYRKILALGIAAFALTHTILSCIGATVQPDSTRMDVSPVQTTPVSPNSPDPPPRPSMFTPPHLCPHKYASPTEIWLKDSGMVPDTSTVVLRVDAVGDYEVRNSLDVAIVMDVTGSMSGEIATLQAGFNFMYDNIIKIIPDARFGVVSFRDYPVTPYGDAASGDYPFRLDVNLTSNKSIVQTGLNYLNASGGVDAPESYTTAVYETACQMGWRPGGNVTRLIIIVGDSFPHDLRYNTSEPSTNPYDTPPGYPPLTWIDNRTGGINAGYNAIAAGVSVCTITTGWGRYDPNVIQAQADIAVYTGGIHANATNSSDVPTLIIDIANNMTRTNDIAAIAPSPTESMIVDVLPPYIEYQGAWAPTSSNNVTITNFNFIMGAGGLWELRWDVPLIRLGEVFEILYEVKSTLVGWQSAGVTSYNATVIYGSDYCKVRYQNWRYETTGDPSDIWCNETNDVSVLVKNLVLPISVVVTGPATGSVWHIGKSYGINWTISSGLAPYYIWINYSTDSGATYQSVGGSQPFVQPNDGDETYFWLIPAVSPSTNCRIMVEALNGTRHGSGVSGTFAITYKNTSVPPTVDILNPVAGNNWYVGYYFHIEWYVLYGISPYSVWINYSTDGGMNYQPIAVTQPIMQTSSGYDTVGWTVPDTPSATCRIWITVIGGGWGFDVSGEFTIAPPPIIPPTVIVSSPSFGDEWHIGECYGINWTVYDGTAPYDLWINLSTDGGYSYLPLQQMTQASSGFDMISWTIGGVTPSTACRISVDAKGGGRGTGLSGLFKVNYSTSGPGITVEHPSGSDILHSGVYDTIRWYIYSGLEPYTIWVNYSTDGGYNYTPITDAQGITQLAQGTYEIGWCVPFVTSSQCRVRAEVTGGGWGSDESDMFAIVDAGLVPAPENLTATAGDSVVTLKWAEIASADGYYVYRGLYSGNESFIRVVFQAGYVDTNVTNNVTYFYCVSAVKSGIEYQKSAEVSARPEEPPQHPAINERLPLFLVADIAVVSAVAIIAGVVPFLLGRKKKDHDDEHETQIPPYAANREVSGLSRVPDAGGGAGAAHVTRSEYPAQKNASQIMSPMERLPPGEGIRQNPDHSRFMKKKPKESMESGGRTVPDKNGGEPGM